MTGASDLKFNVIILMAGHSSRFGQPKAFLPFDDEDNFIQHLIFQYAGAGIENMVIVTNWELLDKLKELVSKIKSKSRIKVVINPKVNSGKFYSLKIALRNIDLSMPCFIQNIDNPFTGLSLINNMKGRISDKGYVVPVYKGLRGHPVLVSSSVLKNLSDINAMDISLKLLLEKYSCNELNTGDGRILANINTKEDFLKYFNFEIAV